MQLSRTSGSAAYAYDADWNLTTMGSTTLQYDGVPLTDDGRYAYDYDAAGRPLTRTNRRHGHRDVHLR